MVAVEGERMLRVAEQCLERAKSFIGKRAAPPEPLTSTSVSTASSPVQSEPQQSNVPPTAKAGRNEPCLLFTTCNCFCFFKYIYCIAFSLCKLEDRPGITNTKRSL